MLRRGAGSVGRKTSERIVDSDETITYIAPPRVRGGRVLCLAAGGALAIQHVLTGLLATPFFGSEAFFWGSVFGAFMLSIALGFALGDRLGAFVGGAPHGPYRLLGLGGLLLAVATWGLPVVARAVLDHDPDSPLAPFAALVPLLCVPGFVLASVVPSSVPGLGSAPEPGRSSADLARGALRRFALALLGGVLGLGLASWGLRSAEHAKIWAQLAGLGAALVVIAIPGLSRPGKLFAAIALAGLAGLFLGRPSEVQSADFEAALSEEVVLRGAGRYYARTADEHVLTGTELERKLGVAERKLAGADKKIAVLLVVETVKAMGPLNISGKGLENLLNIYLPETSKPLILPFVGQVRAVRSLVTNTGHRYHFTIERDPRDGLAHFKIPGKNPGDSPQEFEIMDDFDLDVTTEGPNDEVTKFTIGPQKVETGLIHDTITSPLVAKNVFLLFNASLLSIRIENTPTNVFIKASAQASLGAVQTQLLQSIDKAKVR
jgi:hypothetical protein